MVDLMSYFRKFLIVLETLPTKVTTQQLAVVINQIPTKVSAIILCSGLLQSVKVTRLQTVVTQPKSWRCSEDETILRTERGARMDVLFQV